MDILSDNLTNYLNSHTQNTNSLMDNIYNYTLNNLENSNMISGPYQAIFLSFISKLMRPELIIEIGTYVGYSTLALAEGLTENGKLFSLDIDPKIMNIASENISKSILKDKITLILGDAKLVLKEKFSKNCADLIFIDAEKSGYLAYFEIGLNLLKKGGVMLFDNVLWKGKVYNENNNQTDKYIEIFKSFNNFVSNDKRVEKIILPIRDGIYMVRKIN